MSKPILKLYRIKPSRGQHAFEGFIAYNYLDCNAKAGTKSMKNSLSRRLFQKYGLPPRGYQWGATSFLPTQGMWSVWRCCVESKAGVLISG